MKMIILSNVLELCFLAQLVTYFVLKNRKFKTEPKKVGVLSVVEALLTTAIICIYTLNFNDIITAHQSNAHNEFIASLFKPLIIVLIVSFILWLLFMLFGAVASFASARAENKKDNE